VVAQEVDRGTIELWLSVPEPRWRLLLAKLTALVGAIVLLVAITVVAVAIGAVAVGEPFGLRPLAALLPSLIGFPFAVAGYSALLSSLSSERGRAAGIAGGITLVSYLLWVLSTLIERLSWLRYLSIFAAFKPQPALSSGSVAWLGTLALFAVGLICGAAALVVFNRRDAIT
jgi:ABC-2 type transport system permease protein